jgi:hypothetical protein
MFFKRSLIALVLFAGMAGCAANPNPEAASGPTWDTAAGPSLADWSYDPDLSGYTASGPWGSDFSNEVPKVAAAGR